MLKILFRGLMEASNAYYGDSLGYNTFGKIKTEKKQPYKVNEFWEEDCKIHPSRVACLNYDS